MFGIDSRKGMGNGPRFPSPPVSVSPFSFSSIEVELEVLSGLSLSGSELPLLRGKVFDREYANATMTIERSNNSKDKKIILFGFKELLIRLPVAVFLRYVALVLCTDFSLLNLTVWHAWWLINPREIVVQNRLLEELYRTNSQNRFINETFLG
jgi:hypothetical protein